MKTNLYQELFEHIAFPVFATDTCGTIIYKNRACAKHQPMIRKGVSLKKRILDPHLPKAGEIIRLLGETPYPQALVFADEDGMLMICPPRLQSPDAYAVSEDIQTHCGNTPASLLLVYKNAEYQAEKERSPRIYTDILEIFQSRTAFSGIQTYHLGKIAEELFPKLTRSFRPLGYRIQAKTEDSFLVKEAVRLDLFDFFFWTGRLLYLAMKLSQSKTLAISLASDPLSEHHILRIHAQNANPLDTDDILELFARIAPECHMELAIITRATACAKQTKIRKDDLGALILEYHIPYCFSSALPIHSNAFSEEYVLLMASTLANIRKMLKENAK